MASTEDASETSDSTPLNLEVVQDGDELARAIFHKTSFEGDVVGVNALLAFQGNRNDDGSFDESLFLMRVSSSDRVHDLGCKKAARDNAKARARRIEKGQDPEPVPGKDKRYYCGFTRACAKDLAIEGDNYVVTLAHSPEEDIPEHVAIVLQPKPDRAIVKNDRTEAGRKLALKFSAPASHICECDTEDPEHPVVKIGPHVLTLADAA